jgi:hypothetical protein
MITKNFVEGVNIISKYLKDESYELNCDHDQLWFGSYESVKNENDKARLLELGWFNSEDSWSMFI